MEEIIQHIIDFLDQDYGRGNGKLPGWFYLIMFIIVFLGVQFAKNAMKMHYKSLDKLLENKALSAKTFSEESTDTIEYIAQLRKKKQRYYLTIQEKKKGSEIIVTEINKASIKEISDYLKSQTKLSIIDFI